jgi:hypothetical protein
LADERISWDFAVLGKVTRKRGKFVILDSLGGDRRVVVNLFDANNVEAEDRQPGTNILSRSVLRQVAYHRLYGLLGCWIEGEIGQVILLEV